MFLKFEDDCTVNSDLLSGYYVADYFSASALYGIFAGEKEHKVLVVGSRADCEWAKACLDKKLGAETAVVEREEPEGV